MLRYSIGMFTDIYDYIYIKNTFETLQIKQFLIFDGKIRGVSVNIDIFLRLYAINRLDVAIRRLLKYV